MRRLKLGLLSCAALLAAACATASNTPTPTGNSNRTVTVNSGNASAAPPAAPSADEPASARSTYGATCANCHKQSGEGGVTELDEGVRIKVPSFKTEDSRRKSDEQLARKIANGDKDEGMPAFQGRLSPEQINALVRFIRAEFQAGGTGR
jgi:mono/diheme cytochrome c family protein